MYGYTTFRYPFICSWICSLCSLSTIVNNIGINICVHVFVQTTVFFSFGYILSSNRPNSYGNSMFNHLRNYQIVLQTNCIISHPCQKSMKVLISLQPYQYLSLSHFIILTILVGVKWYIIVVLFYISLITKVTNDVYLLSCVYWPFVYIPQATYHVFDL